MELLRPEDEDNQYFLEFGQFTAAIGQPFLGFLELAPSGELCIIETDRFRELR